MVYAWGDRLKRSAFAPIDDMTQIVEEMPGRVPIGVFTHHSQIDVVVRDGRTGEITAHARGFNNKINSTYSVLISAIVNSSPSPNSIKWCGVGSDAAVGITDVSVTTEIGGASTRTVPRLSWDAAAARFNYTFSFTANSITYTVAAVGLFWTQTGDGLFLKTSIAKTQVSSQDSLYIMWMQSFASA